MKKILILTTSFFLITGLVFANEGGKGKKKTENCCSKEGKDCCKKDGKECSKKDMKETAKPKA